MPTYEYKCPKGHAFELFQKMSDEPIGTCPECGEPGERQISGGAGFLFKGEGFYITDYRSDSYKEKAKSESPGDGKLSTSGGASSSKDSSKEAPSKSSDGSGSGGSSESDKGSSSSSSKGSSKSGDGSS